MSLKKNQITCWGNDINGNYIPFERLLGVNCNYSK